MHNSLRALVLAAILIPVPKLASQNMPSDPCENLSKLSDTKARMVLKSNADMGSYSSQGECLAASIDILGEGADPQDISLLISYLAFERPNKPRDPALPNMHPT